MPNFKTHIKYLKGVGEKKAELLEKELNITTFEDLAYYFPFKYIDRSQIHKISEISSDASHIQLKGKITRFTEEGEKYRPRLRARFTDGSGTIDLIWFKGVSWARKAYELNKEYLIFGRPNFFRGFVSIPHPEIEELEKQEEKTTTPGLQAAYNTTEKLKKNYISSKVIHKLQQSLFKSLSQTQPETLPEYLIEQQKLMGLYDALKNIHFPQDQHKLQKARQRLKFEELFYLQLNILKLKNTRTQRFKGYVFEKVGDYFNSFYKNNLPFELTNAQKRVLKEIRRDLGSGEHSNRLLQGDVGSGKTLVALMCLLIALDNGFQGCIMAPTEILAQQHFATATDFLHGLGIETGLLTGSTRTKERRLLHHKLNEGSLQILIGTHALIEDTVQFKNLGMVVIDEQHRFGVAQRAKLWGKNQNPPHILVMTATPIPRTLSMTLYGDLDVSVIDELPPGRKPVKTVHAFDSKRLRMFGFLKKQIALGRQIYIVYPLIKESENMDYKDLEDGYQSIVRAFPPPQYAVGMVHGQMKPPEKEKVMQLFANGKLHILVATTVIEVGVNVPNASVMVIESAERFGLSQLHQLRGRVGRGADQSFCVLMTGYKLSADAKKRIRTMVETSDGFRIAEADLKLRGPGNMEGTQQSGFPIELKIADLAQDGALLEHVRRIAAQIIKNDPQVAAPEHEMCQRQLKKLFGKKLNWRVIS